MRGEVITLNKLKKMCNKITKLRPDLKNAIVYGWDTGDIYIVDGDKHIRLQIFLENHFKDNNGTIITQD